jgi:hypothetical protein
VGGVSYPAIPQPPGSRALDAGEWFAESCRLEAENRELRQMLTAVLFWLAEREELLSLARSQIARRWEAT